MLHASWLELHVCGIVHDELCCQGEHHLHKAASVASLQWTAGGSCTKQQQINPGLACRNLKFAAW
jgi:hypothetical protein